MLVALKSYPRAVLVLLGCLSITLIGGCGKASQLPVSESYEQFDWDVLEDEARSVSKCVEERTGFTVTVIRGGSYEYTSKEVPDAQWDLVGDTILECDQELVPQAPKDPSEESLKTFYSLEIDAYRCLTNEGYSLSAPVSEATFIEGLRSGEMPWSALFEVITEEALDEGGTLDLLEICPDPANFYWR